MVAKAYFMQTANIKGKPERNGPLIMRKKTTGEMTSQEKQGRGAKEYSPLLRRQN
jgi:hypothetical protein